MTISLSFSTGPSATVYTEASLSARARAISHVYISAEKQRFQMGDYAVNNIKIFIIRRLIESNG